LNPVRNKIVESIYFRSIMTLSKLEINFEKPIHFITMTRNSIFSEILLGKSK